MTVRSLAEHVLSAVGFGPHTGRSYVEAPMAGMAEHPPSPSLTMGSFEPNRGRQRDKAEAICHRAVDRLEVSVRAPSLADFIERPVRRARVRAVGGAECGRTRSVCLDIRIPRVFWNHGARSLRDEHAGLGALGRRGPPVEAVLLRRWGLRFLRVPATGRTRRCGSPRSGALPYPAGNAHG